MDFKITDGSGKISTYADDPGSYIQYDRQPLAVVWPNSDWEDRHDAYLCTLPFHKAYRKHIVASLEIDFTFDFTGKEEELHSKLTPLLNSLENGNYTLSFCGKDHLLSDTLINNSWSFEITNAPITHENEEQSCYDDDDSRALSKKVEQSSYLIRDGGHMSMVATIPELNIDPDRVKHFETSIKKGEKPFIILLSEDYYDGEDYFFVLDGHCKLRAYSNLGVHPHLLIIRQKDRFSNPPQKYDIESFIDLLHPWQVRYIINLGLGSSHLTTLVKQPESKLHRFIKKGPYETHHSNGKRKLKGNYINDFPEGELKEWHDNGKVRKEEFFQNGKRAGHWKQYYRSGKPHFIQSFNDNDQNHGPITTYFENGKKSHESIYENGRTKDGISTRTWYENGDLSLEWTYKNQQPIEKKIWNTQGEFESHQILNEATKQWEETPIKGSEKFVYKSANYKARQKELKAEYSRFSNKGFRFYLSIFLGIILALLFLAKIIDALN